ncbi:MAG: hypothetical protein WDZ79_00890 [Candidatus Paceibacterota bacterium]
MTENSKNLYSEGFNENLALTNSTGDSSFVFLYKKTEKIAAALYLVTDLLDHEEPLRWSLRQKVTALLDQLVSLRNVTDARAGVKNACQNLLIDLVTQLNVAASAGLISQMNGSVLARELNVLATRIDQLSADHGGEPRLEDGFFKESLKENERDIAGGSSRHGYGKDLLKTPELSPEKSDVTVASSGAGVNGGSSKSTKPAVQAKKNKRQSVILHLIKNKGEVGVKDVAEVVSNCSEKTLQRELMALVDEGVLQKTGKRRWTRYSFA